MLRPYENEMSLLTVYIVPTGRGNCELAARSVDAMGADWIYQDFADFNVQPDTEWKMFLFDDEYLPEQMQEAIPEFLKHGQEFDFFECYKIFHYTNTISIAPRIFRSAVRLVPNSLMPLNLKELNWTTILNGFIRSTLDDIH